MTRDLNITEARRNLLSLADTLNPENSTAVVRKRGKPVLAIIPYEIYESLEETHEVMSDYELMEQLRQSIQEIEKGKYITQAEVEKKVGIAVNGNQSR
ncbi:MAG: type II toxin-antitoxin system Phd/YefM family antitoxin [Spirochaetota bacterium]|nr:MAG: type II toxin-antitoxin system Phd/YefM family antitoxin [Spirochaetota bacterium]